MCVWLVENFPLSRMSMVPTLYFDNNASTQIDPRVVESMQEWNDGTLYGNPHAGHFLGEISRCAMSKARKQVLDVFGVAEPEWKCVFTSGASESNNMALKGLVFRMVREKSAKMPPIVILTTEVEHSTIDKCLDWLSHMFEVKVLKLGVDSTGIVKDADNLFNNTDHIDIFSCIHCVAETGTIQPIVDIGRLLKKKFPDCIFHCDASQSIGKVDQAVLEGLQEVVDMVTIAGHKFHGPKGSGALVLRASVIDRIDPLIHGAGQEYGLRGGTENVANIVGLGRACEIARYRGIVFERTPAQVLWDSISEELAKGDLEYRTNSISNTQTPYTLNFSVKGMNGPAIVAKLGNNDRMRVCFSAGSACHSRGTPAPSKVLAAMGVHEEYASSAVRVSLSHEVDAKTIQEGGRLIGEQIRLVTGA